MKALQERVNPDGKALATQDFQHRAQKGNESVAEYIRCLARMFQIAYDEYRLSKSTMLHGQLQDGLKMELMDSPSVSGALTYKELVMAAKNEEMRLSELKKRQAYTRTGSMLDRQLPSSGKLVSKQQNHTNQPKFTRGGSVKNSLRCLYCKKLGQFAHDCRQKKADNEGRKGPPVARQVQRT